MLRDERSKKKIKRIVTALQRVRLTSMPKLNQECENMSMIDSSIIII